MLNYAETASSSTIVPFVSMPCSKHQERATDPIHAASPPPTSPYAIGPVDPIQFVTLQAHLAAGKEYSLLVPLHLPLAFFIDPLFKEGYECGYLDGEMEAGWSVPSIVNWTYNTLNEDLYDERAWNELGLHLPAWCVGWVLGNLAWLAETKRTLDAPFWPPCSLRRADSPPSGAVCLPQAGTRLP